LSLPLIICDDFRYLCDINQFICIYIMRKISPCDL